MEQARRSKRQRVAVDYARLDTSGFADCMRVQHKKLTRAVLKFPEQPHRANSPYTVSSLLPHELAAYVHSTGFANPCVVRGSDEARPALGIRVPEGEMTVERVANLVGRDWLINTIDVSTQSEGPVYTMDEWAAYFASPSPRKPLLNVVSLDLANTSLHDMVSAPCLVKELDLVDKAWPPSQSPTPMVQLYALMSVAGCFMDFHVDFGGSSVWYHVLRQVCFSQIGQVDAKSWSLRLGTRSCYQGVGHTVWLTPGDSLVLGGNFLTGYNLSLQLDIWQMEERLKVRSKFRFPLYKQLMWHTAAHYLALLQPQSEDTAGDHPPKVTKWEKEGLVSLCRCLDLWRQSKDGGDMGKQISNPAGLVKELESCLKKEGIVGATVDTGARTRIRLTDLIKNVEHSRKMDVEELRPLSTSRAPSSQWSHSPEDHKAREPPLEAQEDQDEDEFDPVEDGEVGQDDHDDDFVLDDDNCAWSKQQCRTPTAKKKQRNQSPASPVTKPNVSPAPRTPTQPKKLKKMNSSVRDRLLKKCGIDPRIPLPSPKFKPKQREG